MEQITENDRSKLTRRLAPLYILLVIFLLLVLGRMFYLQLELGQEFERLSAVNRIRHEKIPSSRGKIVDRAGRVLAADQPVFQLVKEPGEERLDGVRVRRLAELLKVDPNELAGRLSDPDRRFILRDISDEQKIRFEENSAQFPGLKIDVFPRRVYEYGEVIGPVVGYTGEISSQELVSRRGEGLAQGDIVGKRGVESAYDRYLRGEDGIQWIETTAAGEYIRTLESPSPIAPQPGNDLQLNLDLELQEEIKKTFAADSEGAVVVMEIPSGRVRSLFVQPAYDPNKFVRGQQQEIRQLFLEEDDPLVNRAVHSRFPPASSFKLVPFMVALENNFDPATTFDCPGYYELGREEFGCWREEGHGQLNLYRALVHSCNVYFYNLAAELQIEAIVELSEKINYSGRAGIDIPGERPAQLSTPQLLSERYGFSWTEGELLNTVIGQGYTLISPIKQAQVLARLLTGRHVIPRLVGEVENEATGIPAKENREQLLSTMDEVASSGTGYWAQHTEDYQPIGPDVAGKTGTVQKVRLDDEEDTPDADAWFVSAAPANSPEYVVVVYLSEAGSAGQTAAPKARDVYLKMEELGYFEGGREE